MDEKVDAISQMNEGIKEFNEELNKADLLAGSLGDTLKTAASWMGVGTISLGLQKMVSSLMQINEAATKSSVILGKQAFGKDLGNNIKNITKNITDLQTEIGISTKKSIEFTNAFLNNRITENLHDATAAAAMFERATGADKDAIVNMYNEMYHGANISTKSINSMMAAMSKTQHTLGLTEKGMTSVVAQAGKMSVQLRGFGATDTQIQKMTTSLTKFASSMEKVGVNAQEAMTYIDDLTNPDNLEANIGKFAQLGISVTDALTGNFDNIQGGLQEFSQRIVDMGPIAGAAYAKEFGYSYSKAVKTAKLEAPGEVEIDPQEEAMDSLKKMSEEVLGISGKIEKTFNQVQGQLLKFGPVILTAMGVVFALLKKRAASIKKGIETVITTGIEGGIKNAKIGAGLTGLFASNFKKENKKENNYSASKEIMEMGDSFAKTGGSYFKGIWAGTLTYFEKVKSAYISNGEAELKQLAELQIAKNNMYKEEEDKLKKLRDSLPDGSAAKSYVSQQIESMNLKEKPTTFYDLAKSEKKFDNKATWSLAVDELQGSVGNLQNNIKSLQSDKDSMLQEIDKNIKIFLNGASTGEGTQNAISELSKMLGKNDESELIEAMEKINKGGLKEDELKKLLGNNSPLLKVITDLTDAETNLETETGNLTDATNNLRKHQENDKQPNLIVEWLKQTKAGKMVTGVKKGVSAVGRFFGHGIEDKAEKKATVKRNALNALQKGAVVGLKGAGGLIKSISSLGLKFGVFGIIMKAIQPLMEKLMTALEGPIGDFQKKIADIFEKPEMKKAINSIVSIVGELLGKLGNILADCLPSILEALMAIAKILLPPLLTVTKWILKALSLIPKALSKLPVVGEAFGKVAEAMSRTGDALGEAGKSIKSLGDSVDTNTDQLKKGNEESKASTMRVASNGFGGAGIVENGAKYEVRRQNDLTKATEEGTAATKEVAVKTEETMNAIKTSQEEMQNMYKTLEDRVLGILTILNDVTNDIRRLNVTVHE
jgi:hypothetical protein